MIIRVPPQTGLGSGVGAVEGGFAVGGGGGILPNSSDEDMIYVGRVQGEAVENAADLSDTAPQDTSKQRPKACHECVHRKLDQGEYRALHRHARIAVTGKPQCQVPVEERRDSVFRTSRGKKYWVGEPETV